MLKRISYKREKCIACGVCAMLAPHIWQMSPVDGKADLIEFPTESMPVIVDMFPEDESRVREAMHGCPSHCITIIQ